MSNRSLVELNHDYCPPYGDDAALLRWARAMAVYMGSADPDDLPAGVTRKHYRHHSEPCPMEALAVIAGGDGDAHEIARQTLRR